MVLRPRWANVLQAFWMWTWTWADARWRVGVASDVVDRVDVRNEVYGGLVLRYRWASGGGPPGFP